MSSTALIITAGLFLSVAIGLVMWSAVDDSKRGMTMASADYDWDGQIAGQERDQAIERAVAAERERCAAIADAEAIDAGEQIDRNLEYAARSGSRDETANEFCRTRQYTARRIADKIRT